MDDRFLGKMYRRIVHKYFLNDLMLDLRLAAKAEAVAYIQSHMCAAVVLDEREDVLGYALGQGLDAVPGGLVCEFGVSKGKTIRFLGGKHKGQVHGFDSFEGLPEDWAGTNALKGKFSLQGKMPSVPANVKLHKGWFDATVPAFLASNPGPAAFLHMDADLYSSTKVVLKLFRDRLRVGTTLVFDEYFNYPNWREHEYRALQEMVSETGLGYEYLAYCAVRGHVAIRITKV